MAEGGEGLSLPQRLGMAMSNFEIAAKGGDHESLESWRKFNLVLNATRRFRYCADLEKRKELKAAMHVRRFLLLDSRVFSSLVARVTQVRAAV